MYVYHTNQIGAVDWGYQEQPIKTLVKVNHECEDFIPILERPSLFFYKTGIGFLILASIRHFRCFVYCSYAQDLVGGFQKNSECDNQPEPIKNQESRIKIFGKH